MRTRDAASGVPTALGYLGFQKDIPSRLGKAGQEAAAGLGGWAAGGRGPGLADAGTRLRASAGTAATDAAHEQQLHRPWPGGSEGTQKRDWARVERGASGLRPHSSRWLPPAASPERAQQGPCAGDIGSRSGCGHQSHPPPLPYQAPGMPTFTLQAEDRRHLCRDPPSPRKLTSRAPQNTAPRDPRYGSSQTVNPVCPEHPTSSSHVTAAAAGDQGYPGPGKLLSREVGTETSKGGRRWEAGPSSCQRGRRTASQAHLQRKRESAGCPEKTKIKNTITEIENPQAGR